MQFWYHNQTLFDMGTCAYIFMAISMFAYLNQVYSVTVYISRYSLWLSLFLHVRHRCE